MGVADDRDMNNVTEIGFKHCTKEDYHSDEAKKAYGHLTTLMCLNNTDQLYLQSKLENWAT
jgi:hypothetical protein